jgi:hypothetical protein
MMNRSQQFLKITVVFALQAAVPSQALALPDADDAIGIPDFHSDSIIEKLPPAAAHALTESQRASDDDISAMLRSDNPTLVSLGLYAADFQSRPDILARAFWLTGDTRPALPRLTTNPVDDELGVIPSSQTVGERYRELLNFWIPNLPNAESALRESLAAGVDVRAYSRTWALRLHRIKRNGTRKELDSLKEEFAAVPETIQWVTLLDPSVTDRPSVFTRVEVKAILNNLSPETKRKIADRTIELPRDYQHYRDEGDEEALERLFDRYDAIMRSP